MKKQKNKKTSKGVVAITALLGLSNIMSADPDPEECEQLCTDAYERESEICEAIQDPLQQAICINNAVATDDSCRTDCNTC